MNQAMVTGGEMSSGKYHQHCNFLYKQMATLYTEKIEASRAAVFWYYTETLHKEPDQNGILDVDVSFDCSWMRRGHVAYWDQVCHGGKPTHGTRS